MVEHLERDVVHHPTSLLCRRSRQIRILWIATAAALLISIAGCAGEAPRSGAEVTETTDHPVRYTALDARTGSRVSMEDLHGRPAIIAAWATWCLPCRRELPALEKLHRDQGVNGLQVVIVNLESSGKSQAAKDFVEEFDLTMTQWWDAEETFPRTFKGFGIPMSVLVDRTGQITKTWYGEIDPDDPEVREEIKGVLAATPGT